MEPPWNTPAGCPGPPGRAVGSPEGSGGRSEGMSASPIGIMGVPPSVFRSRPLSGRISNRGFFTVKKAGLPHPAHTDHGHCVPWDIGNLVHARG